MSILRTWLRFLLGNKQRPVRSEVGDEKKKSCFEAWIWAYRQRLDDDRTRHQRS
jgi:hypothetical protein